MFGLSRLLQWAGELNWSSGTKRAERCLGPPLRREALQFEQLENRRMLSLLGQQLFPSDYPWNQDISQAPVASNSAAIIAHIGGTSTRVTPDWGADNPANGTSPLYGIPYNVGHDNTYSQGTIVTGGTLVVSNANAILSGSNLTVGSSALSLLNSPVAMMRPQAQLIATRSVSEDDKPLPRLPVGLPSDASVNLARNMSGISAPALPTTDVVKSLPASAAEMPRLDPFSMSSAAKTIVADLAWLHYASSSDDLDQGREKDVAILALEALFADYGG